MKQQQLSVCLYICRWIYFSVISDVEITVQEQPYHMPAEKQPPPLTSTYSAHESTDGLDSCVVWIQKR